MNIKFSHTHVILIVPFVLTLLYSIKCFEKKTISFIDNNISSRTFIESEGNSKILAEDVSKERLSCVYKIGNEQYPHLGIGLEKTGDNNFLNIKGIDYLEIELNSDSTDNFNICLLFHIPEFTLQNKRWTHLFKLTEVSVKSGKNSYRIPIKELHTPVWWYTMNRISSDQLIHKFNPKQLNAMVFTNHELSPRGAPLKIDIRKITFKRNIIPRIINLVLFLVIYVLFVYSFYFRKESIKTVAYEKIPIKNNVDLELYEISKFIGENYHKLNFSQNEVVVKTGIPAYKIRQILKKHFNRTFKQHITYIRISEAKRLIRETDRQIIEIAQCVGYRHISTFNHVFKKETNNTPLEYREQNN